MKLTDAAIVASAKLFDKCLYIFNRKKWQQVQDHIKEDEQRLEANKKQKKLEAIFKHKLLVKRMKEAPKIRAARMKREAKKKRVREQCGFQLKDMGEVVDPSYEMAVKQMEEQ